MDKRLEGRKPITAADIVNDPSHKTGWWRSRGVAWDWAGELVNSQATDQVMKDWATEILKITKD